MDKPKLVRGLEIEADKISDKYSCTGCGCSLMDPQNSNFLLVFTAGNVIIANHSLQLATNPLKVVRSVFGNQELSSVVDLGAESVEEMRDGDVWDMLEGTRDQLNITINDEGDFFCMRCSKRLDME